MKNFSISLLFISILLYVSVSGDDCTSYERVLTSLSTVNNGYKNGETKTDVIWDVKIPNWNFDSQKNQLEVDAEFITEWKNKSLDFSSLNPCSKTIILNEFALDSYKIWLPPQIPNANNRTALFHENGTVQLSQKSKQKVTCRISEEAYPFGNTTCTISLDISNFKQNQMELSFSNNSRLEKNRVTAGSLYLRDVNSSEENSILNIDLVFQPNTKELLIHFYIPSLLFLIPPWLTLLLGPMAITRCCILMTSLILLSLHNHSNVPVLPNFSGVNAIVVWELFSFIFVISILVELVIITLLASIGRSRTCCYSKNQRDKYEMEPLYEEMNDLRQRKTRRTRNCCRMAALSFDIASFIFHGIVLFLFCYGYYVKRSEVVEMINAFEMESLYVF